MRIGQVRASQKFASLTTLTPSAFGAQTLNAVPEDALVLDNARPEHAPELQVRSLADEMEVELAQRR